MTETQAMQLVLMRAVETTIPPTGAWSETDRRWATDTSARDIGIQSSDEAFLEARAERVSTRLCERSAAVGQAIRLAGWHPGVARLLIAISLLIGLATDSIGDIQRINLLAPPIWGVLAWNLFVYAGLLAGSRGAASAARRLDGPLSRGFHTALSMLASFPGGLLRRRSAGRELDAALLRFSEDWARTAAALTRARLSGLMHLCALALAAGILAGMYLRGLAWEYRAGWESTFVDADVLASMLRVLLGIASALSGIELPDAARLESIRFPQSGGESAGPWIHLFAITTVIVVIIPRGLLWLRCRQRERAQATDFPIDLQDVWFKRLARARRGEASRILLVEHGSSLPATALTALRSLLAEASGGPVTLDAAPALAYGYEEDLPGALDDPSGLDLVLIRFATVATPEEENHGLLVDSVAERMPPGRPVLVLLDETAFVQRFGSSLEASSRRSQRRNAWIRLLAGRPLRHAFVDLDAPEATREEQIHELQQAIIQPAGAP
jgi:hypothetical protein